MMRRTIHRATKVVMLLMLAAAATALAACGAEQETLPPDTLRPAPTEAPTSTPTPPPTLITPTPTLVPVLQTTAAAADSFRRESIELLEGMRTMAAEIDRLEESGECAPDPRRLPGSRERPKGWQSSWVEELEKQLAQGIEENWRYLAWQRFASKVGRYSLDMTGHLKAVKRRCPQ